MLIHFSLSFSLKKPEIRNKNVPPNPSGQWQRLQITSSNASSIPPATCGTEGKRKPRHICCHWRWEHTSLKVCAVKRFSQINRSSSSQEVQVIPRQMTHPIESVHVAIRKWNFSISFFHQSMRDLQCDWMQPLTIHGCVCDNLQITHYAVGKQNLPPQNMPFWPED